MGGYRNGGWADGVAVTGSYAYVTDSRKGLQVFDVSNPTNCVLVGGYATNGMARDVAVAGNCAYVVYGASGLKMIDVSKPTKPVLVGGYDTSGYAIDVAVSSNRIYVADYTEGLIMLAWPPVQSMLCMSGGAPVLRVDGGTPGNPFTIETTPSLQEPVQWTPILTTNPPVLPFEFADFDVKFSDKPQRFYRVCQ